MFFEHVGHPQQALRAILQPTSAQVPGAGKGEGSTRLCEGPLAPAPGIRVFWSSWFDLHVGIVRVVAIVFRKIALVVGGS